MTRKILKPAPPKPRGETKLVDIGRVKANGYNHNAMDAKTYKRLKASLMKHGLIRPIIVRQLGVGKGYEAINGEHTHRAAKELGVEKILIHDLGEVPLHEARRLAVVSQELHGSPDQALLDSNLAALAEDFDTEELTELPYSSDEILEAAKRSQEDAAKLSGNGSRKSESHDAWATIEIRVPKEIVTMTEATLDEVARDVAPHVPIEIKRGLALERLVADWQAGKREVRQVPREEKTLPSTTL